MMNQAAVVSLLVLGQSVSALPAHSDLSGRQATGVTPPPSSQPNYYCPRLDYHEVVDGPKWQTGNAAPSGASLSYSTSYAEGTTWTIGGDLGLSIEAILKGIGGSAGISASYSETVTKTITIGNTLNCPKKNDGKEASYSCSLVVTPGFVKMGGEVVQIAADEDCPNGKSFNTGEGRWEMLVPRTDGQQNPFYFADACLCEGKGQDDENAPKLKCLEQCTGESSNRTP